MLSLQGSLEHPPPGPRSPRCWRALPAALARRARPRAVRLWRLLAIPCALVLIALLVAPDAAPPGATWAQPAIASASALPPPPANSRIRAENQRPGSTSWLSPDLSRALAARLPAAGALSGALDAVAAQGPTPTPTIAASPSMTWVDTEIRGYVDQPSVNKGESIRLYVSTTKPLYDLEIYRMGWYGGAGSRQVYVERGLPGVEQPMPTPDPTTGLIVANWSVSRTLQTGADWESGVYLIRLITTEGLIGYMIFVVRDDGHPADILYQLPVATYQAYNNWGGKSLYDIQSPGGRAYKVSFDRPYAQWNGAGGFFDGDYNMIRWLEREGYDVTYATSVDVQANPSVLVGRKVFLSNWHDEYWSKVMRDNLTAARDRGMNLAFFDANNMYSQIRYEDSADGRPNRVIVCYKDPALDPMAASNPILTTVPFRDPPVNQPENALLGVMYESDWNFGISFPWVVTNASHWAYEGTGLQNGEALPDLIGYEYDKVWDNGQTPAGLQVLSASPVVNSRGVQSTANGALYVAPSGAIVFTAGTFYWAWKLDDNDYQQHGADPRVQRITANILNRMIHGGPSAAAAGATPAGDSGAGGAAAAAAAGAPAAGGTAARGATASGSPAGEATAGSDAAGGATTGEVTVGGTAAGTAPGETSTGGAAAEVAGGGPAGGDAASGKAIAASPPAAANGPLAAPAGPPLAVANPAAASTAPAPRAQPLGVPFPPGAGLPALSSAWPVALMALLASSVTALTFLISRREHHHK